MPGLSRSTVTSRQQIQDLMAVAMGEAEADMAIVNGDVLNVYTGEVLSGNTVLIKGDKIAYVGKNGDQSVGRSTEVIDAAGKTLIPGLIDGHTHVDSLYSLSELLRYAMKTGTTSIICNVDMIILPLGYQGTIHFLRSAKDQLIKIFVAVAPNDTVSQAVEEHAITVDQLRKLFRRREVIGLGEPYWALVVAGHPRVLDLMAETINMGKRIDGHGSAAKDNRLQAYVASGVSSCHESITVEDVMERLRLGLFVLIREGEIRRELEAISKIKAENIDLTRLGLSTDGVGPWQLTTDGFMDFVVQKAINFGFDPVTAIKMATINIAQHFAIDDLVGGIAPGKYADIVVVPDLRTIKPEYVISSGQLVARDGQVLHEPKRYAYPKSVTRSIRLSRDYTADDFTISVDTKERRVRVRAIDLVTGLVTRETIAEVPVSQGRLGIDVDADLLKVAVINTNQVPGKTFVGIARGFRMKHGAIATSTAWDTSAIIVVGASEDDMAQAVNRIRQLKGGIVLCTGGKILAELPLPIAGVMSLQPMETLARELDNIQRAAASLGFPYPDVRNTLGILSSPAIPFLRICEDGLFNVAQNRFVDLVVG